MRSHIPGPGQFAAPVCLAASQKPQNCGDSLATGIGRHYIRALPHFNAFRQWNRRLFRMARLREAHVGAIVARRYQKPAKITPLRATGASTYPRDQLGLRPNGSSCLMPKTMLGSQPDRSADAAGIW